MARAIRAHCLACGQSAADIALIIHSQCGPAFGTRLVRAHRLALGIALADVVAQVRARYVNEGRTAPRFSETLLSSYEGGQKRPGPEYLHYLCCVYQAEPADLGYEGPCLCGQAAPRPGINAVRASAPPPRPEPGRTRRPGRARLRRAGRRHGARRRYSPPSPARGEADPAEPGPGAQRPSGPIGLTATQLPALEPPGPAGPARPPARSALGPGSGPASGRSRCRCRPSPAPARPAWRCAQCSRAWLAGPAPVGGARPDCRAGRCPSADPAALSMGEMDDDMVRRTLLRLMADPGGRRSTAGSSVPSSGSAAAWTRRCSARPSRWRCWTTGRA